MDSQSLQSLSTLDPQFRSIALQAWSEAQQAMPPGVQIIVIDGRRTFADSDRMAAEPRTGPRAVPGGKSFHNYGMAFDFAMYNNGREVTKVDANWLKVVAIMKKHGIAWGGDFKSNYDPGHFEKRFGHTWQDLLAGYKQGNDSSTPGKPANFLLIAGLVVGGMLIYWIVS